MMQKYANSARTKCPEIPERVHPHLWRHTRAMHLYQHGMDFDILYLYLKNDHSAERIVFTLLKSAGNLKRYIGLLTALSSSKLPVCVKVACFEKSLFQEGIDMSILDEVLLSGNSEWDKSVFVVEENKRWLFFSDSIIQEK